ncbi:hypothetical protein [Hyphococcus luteus]|uniref:Lipoprotein n=1 Tax=Hyphococcus luteus TaxID=2058213 RepID=A0A2S7K4M2_9PROT|nr:hypothetical protein [Marinicaulis flavus]PQA87453.1 hypothetical protein CW354_11650 [Marinicaulis flavus]
MQHPPRRILPYLIAAFAAAGLSGCGGEKSSDSSRPSSSSEDRWLDAWGPEQMYLAQIKMEAIDAGENPNAADQSCEAKLELAEESLSDTSNVGTVVQLMYKTCADAGLKFQNEVRCEADRLQVLCR